MSAAAEIPRPPAGRSLLILGLAGLAFALAQTTLIPAFPELVRALHSDPGAVAWTLTGYLVAAAVFTPVMGRLGDMFGKRRMLVVSLGFFGAGSVISALGDTIEVVVAVCSRASAAASSRSASGSSATSSPRTACPRASA
jgi:MFS family permease